VQQHTAITALTKLSSLLVGFRHVDDDVLVAAKVG
jgi:hypothetical protein